MKQVIIAIPLLIIILSLTLQSTMDTINSKREETFDMIVYRATQTARTDGRFTDANINELKNNILTAFPDVTEGELVVTVTTTPKYKQNAFDEREVINYEISVPLKRIVFANGLYGISDADNTARYGQKGYVLSEVLMP